MKHTFVQLFLRHFIQCDVQRAARTASAQSDGMVVGYPESVRAPARFVL
jgi:hypothetical protein